MDADSSVEAELAQWLNLLAGSKGFVLVEGGPSGGSSLQQLDVVPTEAGMVWLAGRLRLADGDRLDVVLQAHSGTGELHGVYVQAAGAWHALVEENVVAVLGLDRTEVLPFAYELAIPFESDHFQ